jgi:hypothetical protein
MSLRPCNNRTSQVLSIVTPFPFPDYLSWRGFFLPVAVIDAHLISYISILEGKLADEGKKDFVEGIVIIGKLAHMMLLVQKHVRVASLACPIDRWMAANRKNQLGGDIQWRK